MMTKVIFEYSDGTTKYLEGEDVQKWNVFNEQVILSAMIHRVCPPYDQLKWKEGKLNADEQKDTKEDKKPESSGKEDKEAKGT